MDRRGFLPFFSSPLSGFPFGAVGSLSSPTVNFFIPSSISSSDLAAREALEVLQQTEHTVVPGGLTSVQWAHSQPSDLSPALRIDCTGDVTREVFSGADETSSAALEDFDQGRISFPSRELCLSTGGFGFEVRLEASISELSSLSLADDSRRLENVGEGPCLARRCDLDPVGDWRPPRRDMTGERPP